MLGAVTEEEDDDDLIDDAVLSCVCVCVSVCLCYIVHLCRKRNLTYAQRQ